MVTPHIHSQFNVQFWAEHTASAVAALVAVVVAVHSGVVATFAQHPRFTVQLHFKHKMIDTENAIALAHRKHCLSCDVACGIEVFGISIHSQRSCGSHSLVDPFYSHIFLTCI